MDKHEYSLLISEFRRSFFSTTFAVQVFFSLDPTGNHKKDPAQIPNLDEKYYERIYEHNIAGAYRALLTVEESCIEPQEKSLKNMPKNELNADSNLSAEPIKIQSVFFSLDPTGNHKKIQRKSQIQTKNTMKGFTSTTQLALIGHF